MSSIDRIKSELEKIRHEIHNKKEEPKDYELFDYFVFLLYCQENLDYDNKYYHMIKNTNITDGKSDGGIDFLYYDESSFKIIIGQNKYSDKIKKNDVVSEINKAINTFKDFKEGNNNKYSSDLKRKLETLLDNYDEEVENEIEFVFCSLVDFDDKKIEEIRKAIRKDFSENYTVNVIGPKDINDMINSIYEHINTVEYFSFDLDKSNNYIEYNSKKYEGVVVNIKASSLKRAYDKYERSGLFNLNIRRYIKSKTVDTGIIESITKKSNDFWFKNNGITIACKDFNIDGNTIKISNFSIVNGAQTTDLISKKLEGEKDFLVMAKVIKSSIELEKDSELSFFNEIAESTNSQKPIQARDLKSNSPEMINLQKALLDKGIFLEIKRGVRTPAKYKESKITNVNFAQLVHSFVGQKPGTSRSSVRSLFENNLNYSSVFRQQYSDDVKKINFIVDLINLRFKIDEIIKDLNIEIEDSIDKYLSDKEKNIPYIEKEQVKLQIVNQGTYFILAIMGLVYRIVNKDFVKGDTASNVESKIKFGPFLRNYTKDDINVKLKKLVNSIVSYLVDRYNVEYSSNKVKNTSNFLKKDSVYTQNVVFNFLGSDKEETILENYGELFSRSLKE